MKVYIYIFETCAIAVFVEYISGRPHCKALSFDAFDSCRSCMVCSALLTLFTQTGVEKLSSTCRIRVRFLLALPWMQKTPGAALLTTLSHSGRPATTTCKIACLRTTKFPCLLVTGPNRTSPAMFVVEGVQQTYQMRRCSQDNQYVEYLMRRAQDVEPSWIPSFRNSSLSPHQCSHLAHIFFECTA